jgi:hypothetical protein
VWYISVDSSNIIEYNLYTEICINILFKISLHNTIITKRVRLQTDENVDALYKYLDKNYFIYLYLDKFNFYCIYLYLDNFFLSKHNTAYSVI